MGTDFGKISFYFLFCGLQHYRERRQKCGTIHCFSSTFSLSCAMVYFFRHDSPCHVPPFSFFIVICHAVCDISFCSSWYDVEELRYFIFFFDVIFPVMWHVSFSSVLFSLDIATFHLFLRYSACDVSFSSSAFDMEMSHPICFRFNFPCHVRPFIFVIVICHVMFNLILFVVIRPGNYNIAYDSVVIRPVMCHVFRRSLLCHVPSFIFFIVTCRGVCDNLFCSSWYAVECAIFNLFLS